MSEKWPNCEASSVTVFNTSLYLNLSLFLHLKFIAQLCFSPFVFAANSSSMASFMCKNSALKAFSTGVIR